MKQKSINSVLHMYGVGIDTPFYVVWVEENKVHKELVVITDDGLSWYDADEEIWVTDHTKDFLLTKLLLGDAETDFFPFKPKTGERYNYLAVSAGKEIMEYSREWTGHMEDYSNYYCGNCFPYSTKYQSVPAGIRISLFNKLVKYYENGIRLREWETETEQGDKNDKS